RDQVTAVGAERQGETSQAGFYPCDRKPEVFSFGPRVPHPHGIDARRGDEMAFGVPGHAEDKAPDAADLLVAAELGTYIAGPRVPDLREPVVAGRNNLPAVGAERHGADFVGVLGKG